MNKIQKALMLAFSFALSATLFVACGKGGDNNEPKCTHETTETKYDETNHWNECECGEKMDVEAHAAGTDVKYDETNHWNECECGYKMNVEAHTIVGDSNETHHWGECDCGYVAEKTEHTYDVAKSDETHHWNECVCGASEEKVAHDYVAENHDETSHWLECECGAKSTAEAHVAGTEVKSDDTNHWNECECGYKMNVEAHVAGTEVKSDETDHWNECECGYKMNVVNHTYNTTKFDATNHWNECECGAKSAAEAHEYVVDDSDEAVDKLNCACGAEGASFNKVVTVARQMIVLDADTNTLSLEGIDAYESVLLVMFNEYDLGTDLNALVIPEDLKADTASHGEQTVMAIVMDAAGFEHTISIPVTFVTKTLKTAEDLRALQIKANTDAVYGYYVLGGNITSSTAIVAPAGWTEGVGETSDGSQGFCGVLDGNNYTITMPAGARGLFGTIGKSVIKNVTFTCTSLDSTQWATTFLARFAACATFENVNINISNITVGPKGAIIELVTRDCDFINVNINIDGNVQNLFGAHTGTSVTQGMNAAQDDYPDTLCTFTNTKINLAKEDSTLGMLGQCYTGETYNKYIVDGCETTEGIIVDGITLTSPRPDVKLANQDILMSAATASLNLGNYASYTVKSIALNGVDIGSTDVSAIVISETIKKDPTKHGEGNTFTVIVDKDGADYKIAIPVTFVTDVISSAADFAKVQIKSATQTIYGYYILTDDITSASAIVASAGFGAGAGELLDGTQGFCGTLDGRNHKITTPGGARGIFGTLGTSTIKNVDFVCTTINSGNWATAFLARLAVGAKFENVTFEFQAITAGTKGLIFEQGARDCHFNNVEINITGAVDNLFGYHVSNYVGFNANQQNFWNTKCTFTNTTINLMTAGSSLNMLGTGWIAKAAWSSEGAKTVFVADGCTSTGETVEGIKIVKVTA